MVNNALDVTKNLFKGMKPNWCGIVKMLRDAIDSMRNVRSSEVEVLMASNYTSKFSGIYRLLIIRLLLRLVCNGCGKL